MGISVPIASKIEFYQIFVLQWFACDWICSMLLKPLAYYLDIEDRPFGRADWVAEWL
jgi:hypothetical protein